MRKFNFDTPADETDAILKEQFQKITEAILNSGHPVRMGDQLGVFDKYKDGIKVYVKKYHTGNEQ